MRGKSGDVMCKKGARTSANHVRPFLFSNLGFVGEISLCLICETICLANDLTIDNTTPIPSTSSEFGSIRLSIDRVIPIKKPGETEVFQGLPLTVSDA